MAEEKNSIPLYKARTNEIINRLLVYLEAISGIKSEVSIQDDE